MKYTVIDAWTQTVKCGYAEHPEKALEDWAAGLVEILDPTFPIGVVINLYGELLNLYAEPLPWQLKDLLNGLRDSMMTMGLTWPSAAWLDNLRFVRQSYVFSIAAEKRGITIGDTIILGDGIYDDMMSTPFPYPTVHHLECHYTDSVANGNVAPLDDPWWRESLEVLIEEIAHSVQYQTMGNTFYTARFAGGDNGSLENDATDARYTFKDRAENKRVCNMGKPATAAAPLGSPSPSLSPTPAVLATQGLKLNDRAKVVTANYGDCSYAIPCFAPVEAGAGGVNHGWEARTGAVYSVGPVTLRGWNQIIMGDVVSSADVTAGISVQIPYGEIQRFTNFAPHNLSNFAPAYPSSSSAVNSLSPDEIRSLAPGSYQWLTVNSRAHLNLSSGTYYFEGLQTEPQSVVHFNTTNGPVRIFVKQNLMHKGLFDGDPESILVGYTGSNWVNLEGKMLGTLIAPNGMLNVQGRNVNGGQEVTGQGALYAKNIELHQDTLWVHRPFKYQWTP